MTSILAPSGLVLAEGGLLDPNPGLAIWTLITFSLVLVVLRWKVWGPLMKIVGEREQSIQNAIDQARLEREQAEKLLAEQQLAAKKARDEAAEMVRKSQEEVERAKAELVAQARAEADSLVAQARKQIDEERRKALAEVRDVAVELAIAAAGKVIGQKLDESSHRALAEDYVQSVQQRAGGLSA